MHSTGRKVKKTFPYAALLDLDIMGLFSRAVVPESQRNVQETQTEETAPGDDAGN